MFARGAIPEKVKTWCYDEDEEDFTKGFAEILFIHFSISEMPTTFFFYKMRLHWMFGF